jgi:hypothetical protein
MTMRHPQGPSLLIDAVHHRLKAECITGNKDTGRRIATVADPLPVLITILDDLQPRVLPGPCG